ncbi:LOW QUALITY PROTEIN: radical S-adenosyl methionine domain-containing protein 1, mitochondrial-like [Pomacea canaliculata]|uniref:LOW QUALITY PROTEIN: radical S-adenosyl methionine domain-containing protein 1, mitochondrial-like n=1 Tax=Pomacea canaliculata TaxID=400727 RepID=UPI000D726A22|nr:LOW QUALITY PROTEIN: radical S-adenosyl methionine domain-containing protein 1, mitochondrial-like [Pomacea canaliculata]
MKHYGMSGGVLRRHFSQAVKYFSTVSPSCDQKSITPFVTPVSDVDKAAVYVHWPFCQKRCTYCNFNKYICNTVDHERMKRCLIKETQTLVQESCINTITSVFFGGGTPSLAEPKTLESVLDKLASIASMQPETEISMEINPTNLETQKLLEFKHAGINRASIGVQTLNDDALKILGRDHTSSDSLRCLKEAVQIFSGHVSVDMIFGFPGHTLKHWQKELKQMTDLCGCHISLYQLTLERGTQLFKEVTAGQRVLPDSDEVADMYLAAVEILKEKGFEQYEVSNFAKNDNYCLHNIAYWTGQQYLGVGPGSHGRVWCHKATSTKPQREARVQTLEPENWLWEVEQFGHATRRRVVQSTQDIMEELLSVGLRTKWGVTHANWSSLCCGITLAQLCSCPRTLKWISNGTLILVLEV